MVLKMKKKKRAALNSKYDNNHNEVQPISHIY